MESFLFAVNSVLPLILTVSLGYLLKKTGYMNSEFSKMANKLVFRVFIPAMLFVNLYNVNDITYINLSYVLFVFTAVLIVFLISIPCVVFVTKSSERRGALLQATFRSNFALVGIPLAQSLHGENGVLAATFLSAAIIPLFNTLAVVSLSIFSKEKTKFNISKIILAIIKNPLIQSIFIGTVFVILRQYLEFKHINYISLKETPIYDVLNNLSKIATPLALLSLGAQFEFSAIKILKKEIVFGTIVRTIIVPTVCIGVSYLLFSSDFTRAHFATYIAVFATPVAVSSVPMAQEMKADVALAGQLVVWTTIVSAFSIFLFVLILKTLGII